MENINEKLDKIEHNIKVDRLLTKAYFIILGACLYTILWGFGV